MTRTVWMMSDRAADHGKLPGQGRHSRNWQGRWGVSDGVDAVSVERPGTA